MDKSLQLENLPDVLTLWPEAAKLLRIGRNAAYEGAKTGEIPTFKIGKRILVYKAVLIRLMSGD